MGSRTLDTILGASGGRGFFLAAVAGVLAVGGLLGGSPLSPVVVATDGSFPVTVVDDEGSEITITAPPQRIVSLSPANTEIAYALGASERMVGRTDWDDYPPEVSELMPVANFGGVVMEQLVAIEPDLILAGGNNLTQAGDIERMRDLGYTVVVVYPPDIPGVLADIELIGASIGEVDAAAELTARMAADLDAITQAAASTGTTPRTFYEVGADAEIYAPAPDSFLADMIVLAGGDPITTRDASLWAIPVEELLVADPEVIVLGDANYGVCPGDVGARPGWDGMTAVVNGDVRPVDDVTVTRPGPRLTQGLASLARAIHPELQLDGFELDAPMCDAA